MFDIQSMMTELERQRAAVTRAIDALAEVDGVSRPAPPSSAATPEPAKKRRISAAGRRRIAEAARKRWARLKAEQQAATGQSAKKKVA